MNFIDRWFPKPKTMEPREEFGYMNHLDIDKALVRNGVILERARREQRSLNYEERQIVCAIRQVAAEHGFSKVTINSIEIEGMSDMSRIVEKIKVVAKFAYYESGYYGSPEPKASYLIVKSNHPVLIAHGNFGSEDLEKHGFKIPSTPSFDKWDRMGRPCYRGGK